MPNKATAEVKAAFRKHGKELVTALLKLTKSDDERVRLSAINACLDRGWGKPPLLQNYTSPCDTPASSRPVPSIVQTMLFHQQLPVWPWIFFCFLLVAINPPLPMFNV